MSQAWWFALVTVGLLVGCDDPTSPLQLTGSEIAARAAAQQLATTPVSPSQIKVSWTDNVANETGWEIHRSTAGATGTFSTLASYGANTVQHTDGGLAPLAEYCYKVRSFRQQGPKTIYAAFTNVSCSRTPAPPPPAAPSNVDAKPLDDQSSAVGIRISWTDNSADETGFDIERADVPEGPWTPIPSAVQYGVPRETPLCYRVFARRDTVRSAPSNVDCTSFPRAPSNVVAASGAAIDVTWSDNSAVEDGYIVERALDEIYSSPGSSAYLPVATLPANTAMFRDVTAAANARYWYRVWVIREGSRAAVSYSGPASIAIGAPEAPVNVNAVPGSSTSASFSGEAGGPTTADGFRFERSADGVSGWTVAGTNTYPGIGIYELQPEQRVCFRMIAFNSQGDSPASNVDCTTPPAAPSEVVVTTLQDGTTQVTWRDNSSVEDGFGLQFLYEVCDDSWYTPICWDETEWHEVGPNTTSFISVNPRLSAIAAIKDGGTSDWAGPAANAPAANSVGSLSVAPMSPGAVKHVKQSTRSVPTARPPSKK